MYEPKAVEGDFSSIIIEAIEPEQELGKELYQRAELIPTYGIYGPPDMCYLVKENKKGFLSGTGKRQGFYHYVYGVDTSSSATVAVYIKSVMSLAGQNNSDTPNKKAKVNVLSATFCSYDVVSKRDIRVEIGFPGSTNVIAYTADGERQPILGHEWNSLFISSQLRSFIAKPCFVSRIVYQLPTQSSFTDFIACVKILYYEGDVLDERFVSENNLDPLKFGQSFLLH